MINVIGKKFKKHFNAKAKFMAAADKHMFKFGSKLYDRS